MTIIEVNLDFLVDKKINLPNICAVGCCVNAIALAVNKHNMLGLHGGDSRHLSLQNYTHKKITNLKKSLLKN
jgi:hypothetical protein